jgi:Ca2+-binding EF-hand superfamily protein
VFDTPTIEQYQDCTYFTKGEILKLYKRFSKLNPEKIDAKNGDSVTRLTAEEVMEMAELNENPFKKRICQVFSTSEDGTINFEDFLDMFSAFSEKAPWDLKAAYAFRIYDFDHDRYIGPADLERTLQCLTRGALSTEEIEVIIDRVMRESDLDQDQKLSYTEFEHVISRAPDFATVFHMRF